MSTKISWTQEVWNPVTGCSRVSEGCRNCYAEALSLKRGWSKKPWTAQNAAENVVLHHDRLTRPLSWREPRMCFVNSMSDMFHESIDVNFMAAIFGIMAACPQHTFQVLTKRPQIMAHFFTSIDAFAARAARVFPDDSINWRRRHILNAAAFRMTGDGRLGKSLPEEWPLPNVWLGVSCENEKMLHLREPQLIEVPAWYRFISFEPLLGSIETFSHSIDWAIVGGESGPGHRPMNLDWARRIRDVCQERRGTPSECAFFYKQTGGPRPDTGRELDGRMWEEYPTKKRNLSTHAE